MPSVKKGETQSDYMARCVPALTQEGKSHDQAVAQCLNMFKENWQASGGVFEIDMSSARVTTKCDSCKETIDTSKPKPTKGPDGKAKPARPNPAIKATLETGLDTGETKDYHFCDEECLRQYLNKRAKTS